MGRRKISTTVYLTEEQDRLLKLLSNKTKVPMAEYVRQGIDAVISKNQATIDEATKEANEGGPR